MLQPGEKVCDKYTIIELVGRGGMSAVYRARDAKGRELAIKDVERSGEKDKQVYAQSLAVEGSMLRRLDNIHLPHIHDIIENEKSFMLVMDFVEGESLDKVIARKGAQTEAYIYNWGMQICDVLSYLHSQNPPVIYRDMKPANVILQPDGKLVLIDFGTARTQKAGQNLQSDTTCIGTEGFAAPEQYGGLGESDARTDIFCLGATLYNLATGHSPYEPPKGIRALEEFVPSLANSPLNAIIKKCTKTSPLDRYQTAEELRLDLAAAEAGLYDRRAEPEKSPGWKKQAVVSTNGLTKSLTGFLRGKKSAPETPKEPKETETRDFSPPPARHRPWQMGSQGGPMRQEAAAGANPGTLDNPDYVQLVDPTAARSPLPKPAERPSFSIWSRLMLIAAAAAVLLLALGVIFIAIGANTAGAALLIFACAAAVLAVFGIVGFLREK